MDDRVRRDVTTYFQREARGVPRGVRERALARLERDATRPDTARRRPVEWYAAVAAVLLGLTVVGALVTIGLSGRQPAAGHPGGPPPPPRSAPAVAYDGALGSLVLFGGTSNGTVLDDTWIWDGHSWSQARPTTSPPARQGGLAVYDESRRVIVLFGGTGAGDTQLTDTWTWDGHRWSRWATGVSPAAGAGSMIYDPATRTVLLYVSPWKPGGLASSLWSWDGTSWTRLDDGPGPSIPGQLLYDGRRVLLVGAPGGASASETWVWAGGSWSRLSPATDLPTLAMAGAAYDSSRGRVVVLLDGTVRTETWVWDGVTWSRLHPAHQPPLSQGGLLYRDRSGSRLDWYGPAEADGSTQMWRWDGRDWALVARERGVR